LIFRRLVAESALDAFSKLQLSSGLCAFEIGKSIPPEVFDFGENGLQLLDVLR